MNATDRKKIQQTIALLQEVLGQKGGAGGPSEVTIPGFNEEVHKFSQIAQSAEPQLKELNDVLVQAIKKMKAILNYSSSCKKFTPQQMKFLQQPFMNLHQKCEKLQVNKNFSYHARAIKELLSAFFWVFSDSPDFIIKGAIESADFNAIKFQKNKNQIHNDWYKSVGKAVRTLHTFVLAEYKMGLVFGNSDSFKWEDIIKGGGEHSAPQQTSHSQPHHHQAGPVAPKQAVQKKPKKQLQAINWLVANFENQKITFAPGQVQMKHGFFIENCQGCTITIDEKFKSLQMNKCNNMKLIVNSCISGVEVMNGQNIEIYVKGSSPSVAIDKCQKVRLVLNPDNMNCQIISSKVSQLNLSYGSQGKEAKDQMVSEQLITRWNPNTKKYETAVYDKFL